MFIYLLFTIQYIIRSIQSYVTPELSAYASLLFLPHGVRVLPGWLFGWKAIPLLAPAALLTHWLILRADGFSLSGVLGAFSGIICAVITFSGLAKLGMDFRLSSDKRAKWREIMVAGSVASVINTFGMGWTFGLNTRTLAGYFSAISRDCWLACWVLCSHSKSCVCSKVIEIDYPARQCDYESLIHSPEAEVLFAEAGLR